MTKFTDTLKAALEKKHAAAHPDSKAEVDAGKSRARKTPPVIAGKPVKKVTGRGR